MSNNAGDGESECHIEMGRLKILDGSWATGWNYTSYYNWSVRNWENVGGARKLLMRGEPILLNRVIIFLIISSTLSMHMFIKEYHLSIYYLAATIFIGLVYVINVCWNWYVYSVNGSRIHSRMKYSADVPFNKMMQLSHSDCRINGTGPRSRAVATNIDMSSSPRVEGNQMVATMAIMIYNHLYEQKIGFPKESILVFLIGILLMSHAVYFFITLPY